MVLSTRDDNSTNRGHMRIECATRVFSKGLKWELYTDNRAIVDVQLQIGMFLCTKFYKFCVFTFDISSQKINLTENCYSRTKVVSYLEEYRPKTVSYHEVLVTTVTEYIKPLLKIGSKGKWNSLSGNLGKLAVRHHYGMTQMFGLELL